MLKKKPLRKNKKKQAHVTKAARAEKQIAKKLATRMDPVVDAGLVEVLDVEMFRDVEDISDADGAEVPTEEATDADFPLEFGGEEEE